LKVHPFQAEIYAIQFLLLAPFGKKVHREPYILLYGCKVKKGTSLKKHSYLFVDIFLILKIQFVKENIFVPHLSAIGFVKTYKRFKQNGFA
jgi:hypothetical protein